MNDRDAWASWVEEFDRGNNKNCKSTLELTKEFGIHFPYKMPNAWWRFWQWALLGWKWYEGRGPFKDKS